MPNMTVTPAMKLVRTWSCGNMNSCRWPSASARSYTSFGLGAGDPAAWLLAIPSFY
jgi:hypothetical protein